ncbi:neutrophil cytosol factor 1 [Brachyhypopomus gauderio]|uniref:neutrophil cytosol factor 1 n=1 Tax=Brachyhypopomus gauderio TaxID=698409 RepID=UPI0040438E54
MVDVCVAHVEILGFEKRFYPSQHYVYMFLVKWSDQSEKLIYRSYPEIYTFHKSLKEMFPIEAGTIDSKDKIIPSLPAPKWLDSQKSTENRRGTLAEYCRSLLNLPQKISCCQLVKSFFKVRPEDEIPPAPHPLKRNETYVMSRDRARTNPSDITGPIMLDTYRVIADYSKSSKYELNLKAGDLLDIVEKSSNGWWFCQCDTHRGWAPASYLEPLDGPDESEEPEPNYAGELYKTTKGYTAAEDDELTLKLGETIEVIHKLLDGWWVVRKGDKTGYYPSMFLQSTGERIEVEAERNVARRQTPPPRRSTIRNAKSIHAKGRQRISQESYTRQSRRFLQQRGRLPSQPRKNSRATLQQNEGDTEGGDTTENTKATPAIPPRPSHDLIMERCTESTRKRISIHAN